MVFHGFSACVSIKSVCANELSCFTTFSLCSFSFSSRIIESVGRCLLEMSWSRADIILCMLCPVISSISTLFTVQTDERWSNASMALPWMPCHQKRWAKNERNVSKMAAEIFQQIEFILDCVATFDAFCFSRTFDAFVLTTPKFVLNKPKV